MTKRDRLVVAVAVTCFLVIFLIEEFTPAHVVGAYGYVLPILLIATLRRRVLMVAAVVLCIFATILV